MLPLLSRFTFTYSGCSISGLNLTIKICDPPISETGETSVKFGLLRTVSVLSLIRSNIVIVMMFLL